MPDKDTSDKTTIPSDVVIRDYMNIVLEYFKKTQGEQNHNRLKTLLELNSDRGVDILNEFIEKNYTQLQKLISVNLLQDYANFTNLTL